MLDRIRRVARWLPMRVLLATLAVLLTGRALRMPPGGFAAQPLPEPSTSAPVHRLGAYNGTTAKFTINGTAASPPGFDATNSQTLTLQLATNPAPDIYQTQFFIYDPNNPSSPLASSGAPVLTLSPSSGIAATPTGTVTVTMPTSGAHAYKIRCVLNGGVQASTGLVIPTWTYERIVSVRTPGGLRKQIPGESTEYSGRGWTDEQNKLVDAVGDVVNARTFGAVGDGTADDTNAINNAITSLARGTVLLSPGTFKITAPIVGKSYVYIVGAGRGATSGSSGPTLITQATSGADVFSFTGVSYAGVSDLNISATATSKAIHFQSAGVDMVSTRVARVNVLTGLKGIFYELTGAGFQYFPTLENVEVNCGNGSFGVGGDRTGIEVSGAGPGAVVGGQWHHVRASTCRYCVRIARGAVFGNQVAADTCDDKNANRTGGSGAGRGIAFESSNANASWFINSRLEDNDVHVDFGLGGSQADHNGVDATWATNPFANNFVLNPGVSNWWKGIAADQVVLGAPANNDPRPTTLTTLLRLTYGAIGNPDSNQLVSKTNKFGTSPWSLFHATATNNSTTAPDNTSTACTLTDDGSNSLHITTQSGGAAMTSGATFQMWVFAKAGTKSWVLLGTNSGNDGVYFDLTNGLTGNLVGGAVSGSIASIGGGWYLCSAVFVASIATPDIRVAIANGNGAASYAGASNGTIFVWGAGGKIGGAG